jgi:hypothetical protein
MEVVTLTQEMIDEESETFVDGLMGCKTGDKAVRSDELLPWVDWSLHDPGLIGRDKLEYWLIDPVSDRMEQACKRAIALLS